MLKKRLMFLSTVAILSVGLLAGCGGKKDDSPSESQHTSQSTEETETTYTVKYYVGADQYGETLTVNSGDKLTKPADPSKAEDEEYTYTFDGWYEANATSAWNFESDVVTKNLELYAKFNENAKAYDLAVWIWGGTTTVYITEDEFTFMKAELLKLPALDGKQIRFKYVNTMTNPVFNDAVNNNDVGVVVSGAKMDNDTTSIVLDEEGQKANLGFGWVEDAKRYVGIPAGLNDNAFMLAKAIYDRLKENGPYYFTSEIDNYSILLNNTAQITNKDASGNDLTDVTYSSSDDQIASVSAAGVVTGLAVGEANINVKYGFALRSFSVVVTDKEINLKVAIWGQNGKSNTYATEEEIATLKEEFTTYAAGKGVEVVSRFDRIEGNTEGYVDNIPTDTMVVLSGPNVKSQCGTVDSNEVINFTFTRVRYAGVKPGFEDNPIVLMLVDYLCNDTINVSIDGVDGTQAITKLGGEAVVFPDITSTETNIHIGWAVTEGATEALFGADAPIKYAQLVDYAVDHAVTLYPVFSTKVINLKVAVWAINGSNIYATDEEIAAVKTGFTTYAAGKDVEVVSRFDAVSGKTADYPNNIADDVMVILSGKNVKSQCGTLTDYEVINFTFSSVRYFGIVDGYEDNEIVQLFAKYLCDDSVTVNVGGTSQTLTALGGEAIEWPTVDIPAGQELAGWATSEGATETAFGATATVKYADVKKYAVDGAVSLYPVFREAAAEQKDLVVDILLGTAKSLYITEDDVALIKSTFDAALTAASKTCNYEVRAEFRGAGADFNDRVNQAGDVDVVIGASNLTIQDHWAGLYGETTWDIITIAISNSSRYVGILKTANADHIEFATLFCSCLTSAA